MLVTPRMGGEPNPLLAEQRKGQPNTPLQLAKDALIALYTDPIQFRRTAVWLNSTTGLHASIEELNDKGEVVKATVGLPLTNLPRNVQKDKDPGRLTRCFLSCHLIAEKGDSGAINRVSAHFTGPGGHPPKIPYQPGLALGSIVKSETLLKMEEYAKKVAKKDNLEKQILGAEQQIKVLNTKIESRKAETPAPKADDQLIKFWEAQREQYITYITTVGQELLKELAGPVPYFENFEHGVVSPIDLEASTIKTLATGYDTTQFDSQYIRKTDTEQEIHNRFSSKANASTFSASGGWGFWNAGVNVSRASAIASRVNQIRNSSTTQGVLVINAVVTTRNVRTITKVVYDYEKLRQIHKIMDLGQEAEFGRFGISKMEGSNEKYIIILTQSVMGGSFTAIVTLLTQDVMNRDANARREENSGTVGVQGGGGFFIFRAQAEASHSWANTSEKEDDTLKAVSQTRVDIEFISQGALPAFARESIKRKMFEFADLNPSKFELSTKDEAEAEKLIKAKGVDRQVAAQKRVMKLENAAAASLNAIRGLAVSEQTEKIHTMESVMQAYENFADKMTNDGDCGIPIGFNYTILTQSEIKKLIDEEDQRVAAQKPPGQQNLDADAPAPAAAKGGAKK